MAKSACQSCLLDSPPASQVGGGKNKKQLARGSEPPRSVHAVFSNSALAFHAPRGENSKEVSAAKGQPPLEERDRDLGLIVPPGHWKSRAFLQ